MQVLVFNAGSSSLKFGIFSVTTETHEVFKGSYERFRAGGCECRFRHGETDERGAVEILEAFWKPLEDEEPQTAPPLLVYADLMATGDPRNLEAARLVRERYLRGTADPA